MFNYRNNSVTNAFRMTAVSYFDNEFILADSGIVSFYLSLLLVIIIKLMVQ